MHKIILPFKNRASTQTIKMCEISLFVQKFEMLTLIVVKCNCVDFRSVDDLKSLDVSQRSLAS